MERQRAEEELGPGTQALKKRIEEENKNPEGVPGSQPEMQSYECTSVHFGIENVVRMGKETMRIKDNVVDEDRRRTVSAMLKNLEVLPGNEITPSVLNTARDKLESTL